MGDKLVLHDEPAIVVEPTAAGLKKRFNDNLDSLKLVRDGKKTSQLEGRQVIQIVGQLIDDEGTLETLAAWDQKPIDEMERHRRWAGIYFEGCIALNYCADRDGNRQEQYQYALDSYLRGYREYIQSVVDLATRRGGFPPIVGVAPYII